MTQAQSKEARRAQIRLQLGHPNGTKSAKIKSGLKHPVIDSDGHIIEFEPAILDTIEKLGGKALKERFRTESIKNGVYGNQTRSWNGPFNSKEKNWDERIPVSAWWALPTRRTFDRAAAALPGLLYECLDEAGIDFSVMYPTFGLFPSLIEDAELRQVGARATNMYNAEVLKPYQDRMTGVACIPMHTPEEAVAELDFAVKELGFKSVVLASYIPRPIPKIAREYPEIAHFTGYLDNFCLDSPYDYDPVWKKCVELGVSPTFHTANYSGKRSSLTNWMFNHMGVFASGAEFICRAILMGGVAHRFPSLHFGFLEGGVGWASTLYGDVHGHWSKRNRDAIHDYDPANLDQALYLQLHKEWGPKPIQDRLDRVGKNEMALVATNPEAKKLENINLDEFAASGINSHEDIAKIFDRFFFGCEADDPANATAFNEKALRTKLNAVLSSDIGHFDVPDITEILSEAYELIEHDLISEEDFRKFTFTNPARFWAGTNPDFFKGTVIEKQVDAYMNTERKKPAKSA